MEAQSATRAIGDSSAVMLSSRAELFRSEVLSFYGLPGMNIFW